MSLKPGQCKIKTLTITNHKKNDDISKSEKVLELLNSVEIYESIFQSTVLATLTFNDGNNFKERFNFTGNEDVYIEFEGYGNPETLKYQFKVIEQPLITPANNLRSKTFMLKLASAEVLVDSAKIVSKSYTASTKSIVTDIIQRELMSRKKINVEDSRDPPTIVIPFLSPFTAIDYIRKRSASDKYKSSSFVFFENESGFHFTTIEGLLATQKPTEKFFQKEGVSKKTEEVDTKSFYLFDNITVKNGFNVSHLMKNGGMKTIVSQYDFTRKQYKTREFVNNPKQFYDSTDGNNPINSTDIINTYSSFNNKPLFLPYASYRDSVNKTSNFVYDTVAERLAFSNIFTQQKIYIDVPGNTRVLAGTVVELEIPRYDAIDSTSGKNQVYSGKYLVTSVKHVVQNTDDAKYNTNIELMRIGRGVFEK
jgi:hypothetical protein